METSTQFQSFSALSAVLGYDKGIRKLTHDQHVENVEKGYDEGIGKLTYDERVENYDKGLRKYRQHV